MKSLSIIIFVHIFELSCFARAFLFVYFTDIHNNNMHLAYSHNARTWIEINTIQILFKANSINNNCFRDPHICLDSNGTFHMVWTNGIKDSFGYSSSKDLINWDEQKSIKIMDKDPSVKNCWAPETIYNENDSLFYITWSSTINQFVIDKSHKWNHRIFYTTTKDFNYFSEAKIYFDPCFSIIDANIIKVDDENYLMFIKDETSIPKGKNIKVVETNNIAKGFKSEKLSPPITDNNNYWAEGPSAIKIRNKIYVFFDKYKTGTYGAIKYKKNGKIKDISRKCIFPKGMRHGCIFEVNDTIVENLIKYCNKNI